MLDAQIATWPQISQQIAGRTVAVMAFGALEQHGPHLSLATDTIISAGVARRLAQELDAILLPALPFGDAWNNEGFPGTLSLAHDTMRAIVTDIGRGLRASGVRGLIIVNGHFGNRAPIVLAARELLQNHQFPVLVLDYPDLEQLAAAICESQPAAPFFYHADEVETSLVLALMPEAVKMELAAAEYPVFPASYGAEPIMLHTFCKSGVFGDPTRATAAKGQQFLDGITIASLKLARPFIERVCAE